MFDDPFGGRRLGKSAFRAGIGASMERMLHLGSQLSGVYSDALQEAADGPRRRTSQSKFSQESRPEPGGWGKKSQQYMLGADIGVVPATGFIAGRLKGMAALFANPPVHGFAPA